MSNSCSGSEPPALLASGLIKRWPGVLALDGVDLEVRAGEVLGLVGENGAGKSTLLGILSGTVEPDSARIEVGGREVHLDRPGDAARAGIATVFQELSLVGALSVEENIFAARLPANRLGFVRRRRLRARARVLLARMGETIDPAAPVASLPPAKRQVVEVLKAVSRRPRVLLLDEPTSSLAAREVGHLFQLLRDRRARGLGSVFISHHLPEVFEVCDRVTVLRDGRLIATLPVAGLTEQELVRLMVGRDIDLPDPQAHLRLPPAGRPRLEVRGLTLPGKFHDVSFAVRRREIVGLAGLVGAGRTEVLRAVFGAEPPASGTVLIDGKPVKVRSPADAVRRGIAHLPEDRKEAGLFLRMSLRENLVAPGLRCFATRTGWMRGGRVQAFAEEISVLFGIASAGLDVPVGLLSGGNQQKALVGAWAGTGPRVLLADEPTRGIDVAAKAEVHRHLRRIATGGTAVLVASSELPELLALSDRVLVMRAGRIVRELTRGEATEERVIAAALGVEET